MRDERKKPDAVFRACVVAAITAFVLGAYMALWATGGAL
jgi:hypothetical protein